MVLRRTFRPGMCGRVSLCDATIIDSNSYILIAFAKIFCHVKIYLYFCIRKREDFSSTKSLREF